MSIHSTELGAGLAKKIDKSTRPPVERGVRLTIKSLRTRGWRGFGFGGSVVAAACASCIGLILLVAASSNIATSDRASEAKGSEYTLSQNSSDQPRQNDGGFPDATTDLDEANDAAVDLSVDNSRNDQDPSHLFVVDLDAITVRAPGTISALRVSVRCFYCLHEHLRERAPPNLRS